MKSLNLCSEFIIPVISRSAQLWQAIVRSRVCASLKYAVLGVALIVVFYGDVFVGGSIFDFRDMLLVYLPTRMNFANRILNGEFPEWYPFDGLGSSYIGNVVTSILHPFVGLHLFLPHVTALSISVLLAHFFAGWGAYRLLRFWHCDRLASFLGGVAYSGSGYLCSMGGNLPYLEAAAPPCFFLCCITARLPLPLPRHLLRLPQALLRAAFPSP